VDVYGQFAAFVSHTEVGVAVTEDGLGVQRAGQAEHGRRAPRGGPKSGEWSLCHGSFDPSLRVQKDFRRA
jgi:hypothetical protein